MVLGAGKSKIKMPADSVSGEDSSWLVDGHFLLVASCGRERRATGSPVSSYATNLIMRAPPS